MSSIKATQMDGDVSVGRNVAAGGSLRIAGSARVGHDLRVDGWLEAPNVKGANKGVFLTVEKLREAYPDPKPGWIAGVGSSTPFAAWTCEDGEWVSAGGTIDITVDMTRYTGDVAQLQEDLGGVKASIGASDGIAPLNASGQVSPQYLPGYVDDVVEFGGMVESVSVQPSSLEKSSGDAGCRVVYAKAKATFVIESVTDSTTAYYADWLDADLYGVSGSTGAVPCAGKIFVDTQTNKTYRWSGTTLTVVGNDLALGHTSGTAFPGDEGASLRERVDDTYSRDEVDAEIDGVTGYVNTTRASLGRDIETLAGKVNGLSDKVDNIPDAGYTFVEDPECDPLADL